MKLDIITAFAILFAFLVLIVVYKQIELNIQIREILKVIIKANKIEKTEEEPDSRSGSSEKKTNLSLT